MRTLNRRFSARADKPIFNLLCHAMFCLTGLKCEELCNQAILYADDQKTKTYIRSHWLETSQKWGMYARQHSPFLLQVTTTNSCEAWHRKLKGGNGLRKADAAKHGNLFPIPATPLASPFRQDAKRVSPSYTLSPTSRILLRLHFFPLLKCRTMPVATTVAFQGTLHVVAQNPFHRCQIGTSGRRL